eukprot:2356317-Rhodomonas_salina.1
MKKAMELRPPWPPFYYRFRPHSFRCTTSPSSGITVANDCNVSLKRRKFPQAMAAGRSLLLLLVGTFLGSSSENVQESGNGVVLIETVHGHYLTARYDEEGRSILVLDSEGFEPGSEMQAVSWQGGIVLRSIQHDRVLGLRNGTIFFGHLECPDETECAKMPPEEIMYVHEELAGSFTITLKTESGIVLSCNEHQHCSAKEESEAGLNE